MKKTIEINIFKTASIDKAIKEIDNFYKDFESRLSSLVEALGERGYDVVETITPSHLATVQKIFANDRYTISLVGETAFIVEFGAGNATDESSPFKAQTGIGTLEGSWSETHARQYVDTKKKEGVGYWWFAGKPIYQIIPRRPMLTAYNDMTQALPQLVREVFN